MKKLALLAAAFGLVAAAHGQGLTAIGYDNGWNQISARVNLADNFNLDVGLNLAYNENAASDEFGFSVSGIALINLHNWGPVSTHLAAGANLAKPVGTDELDVGLLVGFQPEITVMERVVLSTRFGFNLDLDPLVLSTVGSGISIVSGASFKIKL